jgi:hypothetical protein
MLSGHMSTYSTIQWVEQGMLFLIRLAPGRPNQGWNGIINQHIHYDKYALPGNKPARPLCKGRLTIRRPQVVRTSTYNYFIL